MKLEAAITGDLQRFMREETALAERAVTAGIREATEGLKQELRAQIIGAGLGARLARTWRSETYPKGSTSIRAAGLVWSAAPMVVRAHGEGALIRGREGLWLAIPLPTAPKRVMGKRVTPGNLERAWGIRLRFVYRRGQPSLLVATLRPSGGKRGGFRAPSAKAMRTGTGLASVPMFLLVPQVRLRARFNVDRAARKWQDALPGIIAKHFRGS